jgi:hypothetical protein
LKTTCPCPKSLLFLSLQLIPTILRLAATIPHPACKISIFSYNEKWIIEIEGGQCKQIYKISQDALSGLEDVKRIVTSELIRKTFDRFSEMHHDLSDAFNSIKNS